MELEGLKYEIIITGNASEDLISSIVKYWLFENEKFTYSIKPESSANCINEKLVEIILENSKCSLTFKNCLLCCDMLTVQSNNRHEFLKWIKYNPRVCEICQKFSPNFIKLPTIDEPIELKLRQLTEEEMKVLTGIVTLKKKALIYRHIFNNDISDADIWNIMNTLQRKGLIWIERDANWKIKTFNFCVELNNYMV